MCSREFYIAHNYRHLFFFDKKRLRQSIDELSNMNFHIFWVFPIFTNSRLFFLGKKAPETEHRWSFKYDVSCSFRDYQTLYDLWTFLKGEKHQRRAFKYECSCFCFDKLWCSCLFEHRLVKKAPAAEYIHMYELCVCFGDVLEMC